MKGAPQSAAAAGSSLETTWSSEQVDAAQDTHSEAKSLGSSVLYDEGLVAAFAEASPASSFSPSEATSSAVPAEARSGKEDSVTAVEGSEFTIPVWAWRFGRDRNWKSKRECMLYIVNNDIMVFKDEALLQSIPISNIGITFDYATSSRLIFGAKVGCSMFISINQQYREPILQFLERRGIPSQKVGYGEFFAQQQRHTFPDGPVEEETSQEQVLKELEKQLDELKKQSGELEKIEKTLKQQRPHAIPVSAPPAVPAPIPRWCTAPSSMPTPPAVTTPNTMPTYMPPYTMSHPAVPPFPTHSMPLPGYHHYNAYPNPAYPTSYPVPQPTIKTQKTKRPLAHHPHVTADIIDIAP
eukprot:Sspe_Gene.6197::Locus_2082_Transcript_1_1_Confidence_1.000_Length_1159::g.6197::m.6197